MTWCCDKLILEQASVFFAYCLLSNYYDQYLFPNNVA